MPTLNIPHKNDTLSYASRMPNNADFVELVRQLAVLTTELKEVRSRLDKAEQALDQIIELKHRWRGATFAILAIGTAVGTVLSWIANYILPILTGRN